MLPLIQAIGYFSSRVREHLLTDMYSHIDKHLCTFPGCKHKMFTEAPTSKHFGVHSPPHTHTHTYTHILVPENIARVAKKLAKYSIP